MPKGFPLVVIEAGDCALRKHDRQPALRACPTGECEVAAAPRASDNNKAQFYLP